MNESLIILATGDVHGNIDTSYARLFAYRKQLEKCGARVLLVDAGDALQGSAYALLSTGAIPLHVMNAMRYDASAVGNHEFDYGMDRFLKLASQASFPFLSCNFFCCGKQVFPSYRLFDTSAGKIAFVGISTPTTITGSYPQFFMDENGQYNCDFAGSDSRHFYSCVQNHVNEARKAGAGKVIALAHLGKGAAYQPFTAEDLIRNTIGIDLVIDGHSHDRNCEIIPDKNGKYVTRVACGTGLEAAALIVVTNTGRITARLLDSSADLPEPDPELLHVISYETASVEQSLSEVIASTPFDLITHDPETGKRIVRSRETNLGDLSCDALLYAAHADVAIMTGGSIRAALSKGEITLKDLYRLFPYDDHLTIAKVTGNMLLDALELSVCHYPEESGGWLQVSGITFEIDPSVPSGVCFDAAGMFTHVQGPRRVRNILIGGIPLEPEKNYRLAACAYLTIDHGDGYTMLGNEITVPADMSDTRFLREYLSEMPERIVPWKYRTAEQRIRILE